MENAIDALATSPNGTRRLALAAETTDGTATLRVTDTGPGVSADARRHLFEPFFSQKTHGTGLGLAITKRTIDAHGGQIAARREPGGGMTFEITLPVPT